MSKRRLHYCKKKPTLRQAEGMVSSTHSSVLFKHCLLKHTALSPARDEWTKLEKDGWTDEWKDGWMEGGMAE